MFKFIEKFFNWSADHPFLGVSILIASPIVAILGLVILFNSSLGVGGFGPESTEQITVQRLYVDGGKSSHYMVGTDKGVFEIDNILFPVQIFNCDELYSKLEVGKTYTVKLKGNKVVTWFAQEYPYIIEIQK